MTTFTDQQIADLKASIAAKYFVCENDDTRNWFVCDQEHVVVSDNDHEDPLDAEAEMESIIQDDVKAAMEEMEFAPPLDRISRDELGRVVMDPRDPREPD